MPNNNLTEIIAVLDRSGSMSSSIEDVIGGYNTLVQKQRTLKGVETRITLVIFDDKIDSLYEAVNVNDVAPLSSDVFYARNMTALNDALGQAINRAGKRFAALPEEERPGKVVVFVSTDGLENSSREFSTERLRTIIEEQRKTYSWEFIFTGADIDSYAIGSSIGVTKGSTMSYAKTAVGTQSLYRSVSDKIAQFSSGEVETCAFTAKEKEEVEKHVSPGTVSSTK